MKSNYSDLTLEKYLLGELSANDSEEIDRAQLDDPELAERVAVLRESNDSFWSERSLRQGAAAIEKRVSKQRVGVVDKFKKYFAVPQLRYLTATLTMMLLFVVALPSIVNFSVKEETRLKGLGPHLIIYKKSDEGAERLLNNSAVRSGDLLQISYVAAKSKYGLIFSIDGKGVFTLHYPERPGHFARLVDSKQVILADAFELDDSPKFEAFFFLTSDKALEIGPIIEKLREMKIDQYSKASLKIDNVENQFSLTLRKIK